MAAQKDWAFPAEMRPKPEDWRFDLDHALDAVVLVRSEIPEDAFTAPILGTERAGNGVVINDNGLVLTIGYLITEASVIWLATNKGTVVGGYPMAFDQDTGFGLVQPLGKLGVKPIERGSASSLRVGENVVVAGQGGRAHALKATVFAKREFAGYWEYVLDEALFTAPAHPQWGGSALIGADGKLAGIGSLLVQEKIDASTLQGNMIVPIDLLAPILDDMTKTGRAAARRVRGWACTSPRPASAWWSPGSRPAAPPSAPAARRRRGDRSRRRQAQEPRRPLAQGLGARPLRRHRPAQARAQRQDRRSPPHLRRPRRLPQETPPALIRGQGRNFLGRVRVRIRSTLHPVVAVEASWLGVMRYILPGVAVACHPACDQSGGVLPR